MFRLSDPLGTIRVRKKRGTPRSLSKFQKVKQETLQCIPMIFLGSPYLCFYLGQVINANLRLVTKVLLEAVKNLALITLQIVIAGEGEGRGCLPEFGEEFTPGKPLPRKSTM